jgi:hypothetical protein
VATAWIVSPARTGRTKRAGISFDDVRLGTDRQ